MKIVSLFRRWTRVQVVKTGAQVVKTGVVDQMTMCQADGLDTTEYFEHMSKCSKFSIRLHVFTDAVTSEPQTPAVI